MVAGADGRSLLVEQFARAPAGGGDAGAELTRLAANLLTVNAPGADGRSALLEQLAGRPPPPTPPAAARSPPWPISWRASSPRRRGARSSCSSSPRPAARRTGRGPSRTARAPRRPTKELTPGMVVGRFEMVKEIGSGGFGVVFEARDRDLGRSVAFKAVRPGVRTRQLDAMLLKEAESAASLQHENIVSIFDYGQSEAGPYLVLELLKGETLAGAAGARPDAGGRGRARGRPGGPGAGPRPRRRAPAPRPQARQRLPHRVGRREGDGPGPGPLLRPADRPVGHAGLHGPRAVEGGGAGRAHRRLRTGRDALRDAGGAAPLRGPQPTGARCSTPARSRSSSTPTSRPACGSWSSAASPRTRPSVRPAPAPCRRSCSRWSATSPAG